MTVGVSQFPVTFIRGRGDKRTSPPRSHRGQSATPKLLNERALPSLSQAGLSSK